MTPSVSRSATNRQRASDPGILARVADSLVAVLLAPACAGCATPLATPTRGPICGECWTAVTRFIPPLCERCGDPLLSWRETFHLKVGAKGRAAGNPIEAAESASVCHRCAGRSAVISRSRAIGPYDGSLRAILHALKYDGCRSLSRGLGALLQASAPDVLSAADVVVPVPLHYRRERARGFNQARELAGELDLPVLDVLKRIRATPSQTGLPAPDRRANMIGAFTLRRNMDVAGLRVALVDDVSTTGATMEACAEVLRAAGASDVSAVTAARVVSRPLG